MPVPIREIPIRHDDLELHLERIATIADDYVGLQLVSHYFRIDIIDNEIRVLNHNKTYHAFDAKWGTFQGRICQFRGIDNEMILSVCETPYPHAIKQFVVCTDRNIYVFTVYGRMLLKLNKREQRYHGAFMQGYDIIALSERRQRLYMQTLEYMSDEHSEYEILRCKVPNDIYTFALVGKTVIIAAKQAQEIYTVPPYDTMRTTPVPFKPMIAFADEKRLLIIKDDYNGACAYNFIDHVFEVPRFTNLPFEGSIHVIPLGATVNYEGRIILINFRYCDGLLTECRFSFYSSSPPQNPALLEVATPGRREHRLLLRRTQMKLVVRHQAALFDTWLRRYFHPLRGNATFQPQPNLFLLMSQLDPERWHAFRRQEGLQLEHMHLLTPQQMGDMLYRSIANFDRFLNLFLQTLLVLPAGLFDPRRMLGIMMPLARRLEQLFPRSDERRPTYTRAVQMRLHMLEFRDVQMLNRLLDIVRYWIELALIPTVERLQELERQNAQLQQQEAIQQEGLQQEEVVQQEEFHQEEVQHE